MERRHLQTRVFRTNDEKHILGACAGLLQDLGFSIDETESGLGLIVASKERSAVETGQVVGAFFLTLLSGTSVAYDKYQRMRACVVTRRLPKGIAVRVTFQRVVWNTRNQITRREGLFNRKFYQEFFGKLSKAVFLEAQDI